MPWRFLAGAMAIAAAAPVQAGSILDLAAERAVAYDSASLDWTCDETVRASNRSEARFALLMSRDGTRAEATETRIKESSPARRPSKLASFPSITSWLRLFHPATMPFELIEDRGEEGSPEAARHAFAFRGALPYAHGEDIREWEGTAWLDARTGDLLSLEAVPSSQDARLAVLSDLAVRHTLGIAFFGIRRFRLGPRAYGHRIDVSFGEHGAGLWLPYEYRLETFEAVTPSTRRSVSLVVDSLDRCRRFSTTATPATR